MKHPFNTLTKADVEYLRKKPAGMPRGKGGFTYNFSQAEVDVAIKHLQTLYTGRVYQTFAEKILIRNEVY